MLSYKIYKLIHLLGIMLLFASLGAVTLHVINGGDRQSNRGRKLLASSHGTALLLILVGGFGMLARLDEGLSHWVGIKIVIWVALGAGLTLAYKKPAMARVLWWIYPCLGLLAAWTVLYLTAG